METQHLSLNIDPSAGGGAPSFDISDCYRVTFQVSGITSSALFLEATLDGTTWATIKTPLANGIFTLDSIQAGLAVKQVRAHTTTISGGETPVVFMLAQRLGF
jgi:hypothetical protein